MGAAAGSDLSLHDGSFHLAPLPLGDGDGTEGGDAASEEHTFSALELQDEEFVTKEQAHT